MKRLSLALLVGISIISILAWHKNDIRLWLAVKVGSAPEPTHPSIIMLGDSHVEFVNWRILEQCDHIANFGVGGNSTAQILARLADILRMHPRLVIVMAGTNDARRYVDAGITADNLRAIEREVTESGARYISLSPPPLPSRGDAIDVAISSASISIPFTEADLLDDKIHLRRSGYAKWRDAIEPLVRKYC